MADPIVVEQRVGASAHRVFEAWLTPEALATWWWPHIPDTTYAMEARPGGSYAIRSEAAGIGVEGERLCGRPLHVHARIALARRGDEWL